MREFETIGAKYTRKWNIALPDPHTPAVRGWNITKPRSKKPGWNIDQIAYKSDYPTPRRGQYFGALGMNVANRDPNFALFSNFPTDDSYARWFPMMVSAGVRWARTQCNWDGVEPNAPVGGVHTYNWNSSNVLSQPDLIMRRASEAGIAILFVVSGSAPWNTTTSTRNGPLKVANYPDYVAYCQAIATRYGKNGLFWAQNPDLVPVPLSMGLWNEPYQPGGWGNVTPDPAAYANLVHPAATAIRAIDPTILIGLETEINTYTSGHYFHTDLLAADPSLFTAVDYLSIHPYLNNSNIAAGKGAKDQSSIPSPGIAFSFYRVGSIKNSLKAAGLPELPIWITEFGFGNSLGVDTNGNADPGSLTPTAAAMWWRDALDMGFQHFGVAKWFPFNWAMVGKYDSVKNPQPGTYNPVTNSGGGLLGRDNNWSMIEYGYDTSGTTLNWFSQNPIMKPAWYEFLKYAD